MKGISKELDFEHRIRDIITSDIISINRDIIILNNQKEHHRKKTFKKEYLEFLDKYNIEYKDEYLFKWINDE